MDLILNVFLILVSIIGIFVTACIAPHLFVVALACFLWLTCFMDVKR